MCGINGTLGEREAIVSAMNLAIAHRGPDQTGVRVFSGVTIGMDRLSIIDLSENGRQPMMTVDGRFAIVFNGEIYNFRELKKELESLGHTFHGNSDTEVLLEGYAQWGSGVVSRLRGMWGFAVVDKKANTLFLSRDPFGIKPLYFYDDGVTQAFSSEIRGLLAHKEVVRHINTQALNDLLMLGYIVAPDTILKHVTAFLPGESRTIHLNDRRTERNIERLPSEDSAPPSDDELLKVLTDSVAHHLIADVPVGLFFSGGIDSSLLASVLTDMGVKMTGYHIAIEGKSDTTYAREIAKSCGIRMIERYVSPNDTSALMEEMFLHMDEPIGDSSLLPTYLVSELAKKDVKVVLSGEGGDELFGGYARSRRLGGLTADLAELGSTSPLRSALRGLTQFLPTRGVFLRAAQSALRRGESFRGDPLGTYLAEIALPGVLGNEWTIRERFLARVKDRETPDGALAIDRLMYLPDNLLLKIDMATMAHSIEGRVPFLDREVFRLVGGAPLSWKRERNFSKAPLRRLLAKHVPVHLIDRPKQGFSFPVSRYLSGSGGRERLKNAQVWAKDIPAGVINPTLLGLIKNLSVERDPYLFSTLSHSAYALVALHAFVQKHQLKFS